MMSETLRSLRVTRYQNNMTITTTTIEIFRLDYGGKLERAIARLMAGFTENNFDTGRYPQRWLAIKLLEADPDILERVKAMPNGERIIALAQEGALRARPAGRRAGCGSRG